MKRWQDRGEVEDSEDEELSLEDELTRQEPPKKRFKHAGNGDTVGDQDRALTVDVDSHIVERRGAIDDAPWLKPKVAKTYGRKAGVVRKAIPSQSLSVPASLSSPRPISSGQTISTQASHAASVPSLQASSASVERRPASQRNRRDDGADSRGSGEPAPRSPQIIIPACSPTSATNSPSLDTLGSLFAGQPHSEHIWSSCSSPLSEREVSPPLGFVSPRPVPRAEHTATEETNPEATSLGQAAAAESTIASEKTAAATRRRNLRNRKDIQLHPYEWDRINYLKQCRARGLKPIREVERRIEDSQSASQSSSSQDAAPLAASRTSPEQAPPRADFGIKMALDYFGSHDESSAEEIFDRSRLTKHRRLANSDDGSSDSAGNKAGSALDQFSIPPSPPKTSSDCSTPSQDPLTSGPAPSRFRFPAGFTPAPLPTPQISSEARGGVATDDADSDRAARRSRPSTLERQYHRSRAMSLSSATDEESEIEARRLRKERKRIKGVLPASWLRIDFQAQKKQRSSSPVAGLGQARGLLQQPEPQKGVARKVVANVRRGELDSAFAAASDEVDSDELSSTPLPALRQSHLNFSPHRSRKALGDAADNDLMENDFVDPMLAGPLRQRNRQERRLYQPRIKDAMGRIASATADLSEERTAQQGPRTVPRQQRRDRVQAPRRHRNHKKRASPVQLSIEDALPLSSAAATEAPGFIRLALRRTRQRADRGRHSPTSKHIRLATSEETNEASAVLRAWRDGTLLPRQSADHPLAQDAGCILEPGLGLDEHREALQEISANPRSHSPYKGSRNLGGSDQVKLRSVRATRPRLTESQLNFQGTHYRAAPAVSDATTKRARRPLGRLAPLSKLRGVQLEALESDFDAEHRSAVFERRMQCLTEHITRPSRPAHGLPLTRYLRENTTALDDETPPARAESEQIERHEALAPERRLPHRPRKRQARRINAESERYRQPSETLISSAFDLEQLPSILPTSGPVLQGLGAFGSRYPVDFDIEHLRAGAIFQSDTFIGSGELKDALELHQRDLDCIAGRIRVHVDGNILEWGAWDEEVSSQLARFPEVIAEAIQFLQSSEDELGSFEAQVQLVNHNVDYLLRSVIRYCAKCLCFADFVDRRPCVEGLYRLAAALVEIASSHLGRDNASRVRVPCARVSLYGLVLAHQAFQISQHPAVSDDTRSQIEEQVLAFSRHTFSSLIVGHLDELRSFCEHHQGAYTEGLGTHDDAGTLGGVVVLNNIFRSTNDRGTKFWEIMSTAFNLDIESLCDVREIDKLWHDIVSILPALEIDSTGVLPADTDREQTSEGWTLVKALVGRVLNLYEASSQIRGFTVNDYVRTWFSRCYYLISKWGWRKCEPILNLIYDFFARRSLALLRNEESRGSPRFLESFDAELSLDVVPNDNSFHVFLKLLTTGLLRMRQANVYEDRKIRAIAYRLIPNHGRTFRKDAIVQRAELDALRNHFDLLCVLYCAAPPGFRIALDWPRNLIDHAISHREACRLSIRAWAYIASFQAATLEPVQALNAIAQWFAEILKTTVAQYRLARSEAEQAVKDAEGEGLIVNHSLLEATISKNQQEIVKILIDACAGLKRAISAASSSCRATTLLQGSEVWNVLDLFDPTHRRLFNVMMEILAVAEAALNTGTHKDLSLRHSPHPSDDSQEFGDCSALQEFAGEQCATDSSNAAPHDVLMKPVWSFLSNAIGADSATDENLLRRLIDVWSRIVVVAVSKGERCLSEYVDEYSTSSWHQMRDTTQKRTFTTYFMARLVEQAHLDEDVRQRVMNAWLLSLVEREALLKFQHTLTSALLNRYGESEPLLHNLPFSKHFDTGTYEVSLRDFRQRRLSTISSVLSNMRKMCDQTSRQWSNGSNDRRNTYAGMLRRLMQTMKNNYQDLQAARGSDIAEANVRGAYVEFVQHVVSYLQQHTVGICVVDRFFTDSAAFPLPAGDPTYVVGRLRSYSPKLYEMKTRMQLAIFVQSVSERAAVDEQQPYLASQLATAMHGVTETGDEQLPTLRHVLLSSIFPAYIDNTLTTACSWIPVLPMLQACETTLPDLLYNTSFEDASSIAATVDAVTAVLHSISGQCESVLADAGLLGRSHVLCIVRAMFRAATACLTTADYVRRATVHGMKLWQHLQKLLSLGLRLQAHFDDSICVPDVVDVFTEHVYPSCWPDVRSVADKQVRTVLNANWYAADGQYFVRRGNMSREIVVQLRQTEEEQEELVRIIGIFCKAYSATCRTRPWKQQLACDTADLLGGLVI